MTKYITRNYSSENTIIGKYTDTENYVIRNSNDIPRGIPQQMLLLIDDDFIVGAYPEIDGIELIDEETVIKQIKLMNKN